MAILDHLPTVMECEYCVLQIYEDETNMYWTARRMEDEDTSYVKEKLIVLGFKSKEPLYVNDANINRLFNIDLECDGVLGQ